MQPTLPDSIQIARQLCKYLTANLLGHGTSISLDSDLVQLGIDSFSLLEIIVFLETTYGYSLPLEFLTPENTKSIQALADCYTKKALIKT